MQINVGRGEISHEISLAMAHEKRIDIVLVQEPYIYRERERRITKRHPSYECFSPSDDWTSRPRVLTYIRKGAGLKTEQTRPIHNDSIALRDLLFTTIKAKTGPPLMIVNIYNAPNSSEGAGEVARTLRALPQATIGPSVFVGGDLNLHHERWQPAVRSNDSSAEDFLAWADERELSLISEEATATHNRGNVLDLAFASTQLALSGATASVSTELDVGSDHLPMLSHIPWSPRHQKKQGKLRPDTLIEDKFLTLLETRLKDLLETHPSTPETLDKAAHDLTAAIQEAYRGSAKTSRSHDIGQPWWNEDCEAAVAEYRRQRRDPGVCLDTAQQDLRRTTRKAKREYWRKRLDDASTSKEVFDMTKWHKSTGTYRSPPLKDPTNPTSPRDVSLKEKREVLARNLLQNTAEAGDIAVDCPTVATASLPFPLITLAEIRRSVLGAASTSPGEDELPTKVLRTAWPLIETRVEKLFQACLYHSD